MILLYILIVIKIKLCYWKFKVEFEIGFKMKTGT